MAPPRSRDAAVLAALERRLGAGSPTTLTNLAWFAARRGDYAAALGLARRAVALPHAPRAAYRTLERLAAGRAEGLLLTADDAAVPSPSRSGSPLAAAVAAHRHAEFAVAEACYRAAAGDVAFAVAAWNGLAVLHEHRNEQQAADAAWLHALATPAIAAEHNRALAALRRGAPGRTRALLAQSAHHASAPLLFLAGYAALVEHDAAAAVPLLHQAIAADPALPRAHFTLGLAHERLGEHAPALEATRRALMLSPWYLPQVWLLDPGYGPLVEIAADVPQAGDPAPADDVLLALGRSLLERAHLGEALAVFDQVLVQQPSQTAALFHRGVVLAKLRRYGEALEDWEAVERVDPDSPLGAMSRRHARSARELATLFTAEQ
ncbi:MAG TPA: tetratricopeptide repeat protein [Gemmatimonadales bacterium]|jgi:tetratricopeptide (TPR) repeat protein|nr:tetratricopeptide repeat protein [Gemmatimonadales bacterium]